MKGTIKIYISNLYLLRRIIMKIIRFRRNIYGKISPKYAGIIEKPGGIYLAEILSSKRNKEITAPALKKKENDLLKNDFFLSVFIALN